MFSSIADAAKKARTAVSNELMKERADRRAELRARERDEKEANQRKVAMEREAQRQATAAARREARQRATEEREAARESERAAKRAADQRMSIQLNSARMAFKIAEDEVRKEEQLRARSEKRYQQGVSAIKGGAMSLATSVGGRAIRMATGIAGDLMRGVGVDTDAGSHFKNAADLESAAVLLSNNAYIKNDPRNNQRVDPRELQKEAFDVANQTGFSANEIIGAEHAYVGKTGDLATGREVMSDLAKLSRATGTDLEDMANAAAEVSNQLGDTPNKAEKLKAVMAQVAGAGKLGAVEISDLASQMAKVAASAQQIEGDPAQNIALLGAFAQEAKLRGGAATASQAATSVQGMIATLKTPSRVSAFKKAGIDVYNDQGFIRDPQQILIEALQKKGMDPVAFKDLYKGVAGARAVEGFASIYRRTYASTEGTDAEKTAAATRAVNDEFERLKHAAMENEEMQQSFAAAMDTSQTKAQLINNEWDKLASETKEQLLPALQSLVPIVREDLVPAFRDLVAFVSWFSHTNKENSAAVSSATDRAKNALASGDTKAMVAAERDLASSTDRQGEDKLKTETTVGKLVVLGKGFAKGLFDTGGVTKDSTPGEKADQMLRVFSGYTAFAGAAREYDEQKKQDDETTRTQQEGNKILAEIRDAIKNQPQGQQLGGAPPPDVNQNRPGSP